MGFKPSRCGRRFNIIDRIYERFHITTENELTIVNRLGDEGLSISARQVKRARLKYGWRRRAVNSK
jgi:hypothetical protein